LICNLLNVIYPRRCPICTDIVTPKGEKICKECINSLVYIQEPRCKKCSKPIEHEDHEYCGDCNKNKLSYQYGFALWSYNLSISQSISDYKNKGKKEYADFYIEELVRCYGDKIKRLEIDALVPVPLHKSRQNYRGYNQSEIIAKGLGKALNIVSIPKLLIRNKKTLRQKDLNDKERLENIQKAFVINKEVLLKYKNINKVMLVDDIYTTGSTIDACSKVLLSNKIEEVYFVTLSIGQGY